MAKKEPNLTASSLSGRLGGAFENVERSAARGEPSRRKGIGGTALTDDTKKNLALRQQQAKTKGVAKLQTASETAKESSAQKWLRSILGPRKSSRAPAKKSEGMPTLGSLVEATPSARQKIMSGLSDDQKSKLRKALG